MRWVLSTLIFELPTTSSIFIPSYTVIQFKVIHKSTSVCAVQCLKYNLRFSQRFARRQLKASSRSVDGWIQTAVLHPSYGLGGMQSCICWCTVKRFGVCIIILSSKSTEQFKHTARYSTYKCLCQHICDIWVKSYLFYTKNNNDRRWYPWFVIQSTARSALQTTDCMTYDRSFRKQVCSGSWLHWVCQENMLITRLIDCAHRWAACLSECSTYLSTVG